MKYLLTITLCILSFSLCAQEKFTEKLQRIEPGKGRVVLFQSDFLTRLVNNQIGLTGKLDSLSSARSHVMPTVKNKHRGYRIQVFAGGNSRASKKEAEEMKLKVLEAFPTLEVYNSFISPRWVCRVGNFTTYQEAVAMMHRMKESGEFKEISVVRTMIEVNY